MSPLNSDVELWNGTLSSGQSLTVPGISKYRAIYATIQGYKRVMFLSDTQSGFCGASAQGAQLSMSRLDISGDTVTFSGMTINFNPDGSVSNTIIPECTRISGYLTKITILQIIFKPIHYSHTIIICSITEFTIFLHTKQTTFSAGLKTYISISLMQHIVCMIPVCYLAEYCNISM